jgi:ribonuclease P protein component
MQRVLRLRGGADFQRVRANRHSLSHPLLILYTAPNDLGHPRVGVLVSRRIGKAVVRNLVRRRIREAARQHLDTERGRDFLFIARPPSASASWASLEQTVGELLRRTKVGAKDAETRGRGDSGLLIQ